MLLQAQKAAETLAGRAEPDALLARAAAQRAEGLLHRELGDYPAAIAAHKRGLATLEPLLASGDDAALLEKTLQLAE